MSVLVKENTLDFIYLFKVVDFNIFRRNIIYEEYTELFG